MHKYFLNGLADEKMNPGISVVEDQHVVDCLHL